MRSGSFHEHGVGFSERESSAKGESRMLQREAGNRHCQAEEVMEINISGDLEGRTVQHLLQLRKLP